MVVHQEPGATLFLEHVCRQSCPRDDFPAHWAGLNVLCTHDPCDVVVHPYLGILHRDGELFESG